MQRTLLVFNAIVLVAIGTFIFPLLFEVRNLREEVQTASDPVVTQEQNQALTAISSRVDQIEQRLAKTDAELEEFASTLKVAANIPPEFRIEIERLEKQLGSQSEELARLNERILTDSSPAPTHIHIQEQINKLKADIEKHKLVSLPIAPDDRLSGTWRMTLPLGYQREVTIQELSPNRFRLLASGNMSGQYRRRHDKLSIIKPDAERLTGFVWKIESPHYLRLIKCPPTSETGADYTGTVLARRGP